MKENIAILGAAWGDEGKGRVVHQWSKNFDLVVRTAGGDNCGHVVYRDGIKFAHHLIPSVDFRFEHTKAYLGSGMVINPESLFREILELLAIFPNAAKQIYVDQNAFLVEESHIEQDKANNGHIGTTNRGIGPAYMSKISRKGRRISDALKEQNSFLMKLKELGVNFDATPQSFRNKSMLFEGAQGVLLDIDAGAYPFVTSTNTTTSSIISSGFGFAYPKKIYGVSKCYTTKVGEGPFPSELEGEKAEELRKLGNEFGSTTGRPRRIGNLNLDLLKYAVDYAGITDLIITKLDVLNKRKVKLDTSYVTNSTKDSTKMPFYVFTDNHKTFYYDNAKNKNQILPLINHIEEYIGVKVSHVSCGVSENDFYDI